jgi:hypothetical protein
MQPASLVAGSNKLYRSLGILPEIGRSHAVIPVSGTFHVRDRDDGANSRKPAPLRGFPALRAARGLPARPGQCLANVEEMLL